MSKYDQAPYFVRSKVDHTIKVEGGYVNHEDDLGGATNYGITESVARSYGYEGDMKDLPLELARDIYCEDYYYKPKYYLLEDISEAITKELFDTGVNCGVKVPVKFLQRILNVFNNKGTYYDDIAADGYMGNDTLNAYSIIITKRRNTMKELTDLLPTYTLAYNAVDKVGVVHVGELETKARGEQDAIHLVEIGVIELLKDEGIEIDKVHVRVIEAPISSVGGKED